MKYVETIQNEINFASFMLLAGAITELPSVGHLMFAHFCYVGLVGKFYLIIERIIKKLLLLTIKNI